MMRENMMRKLCVLVTLLLLLRPVCGQGLRADNFKHYNDMKTWSEAQAHCRSHHTDLVSSRDETENIDLIHGWIGLYREDSNSKWKWSRTDEIANFTIWEDNNPVNGANCAYKFGGRKVWHSDPCNVVHTFTCYDEKLVLVKEKKTWEQALNHCRNASNNRRYYLATLLTEDDHVFAREKAQGTGTTNEVWTGLRYLADHWVWIGGETVQYSNITRCPTHRVCGILENNSTRPFEIRDCKERKHFLCYKKP